MGLYKFVRRFLARQSLKQGQSLWVAHIRTPSWGHSQMNKESRGIGLLQVVWIWAGILVAVAAGFHLFHRIRDSSIRFSTLYQAVLLTNGSVYFGHAGLWQFSSASERRVLRRESNRPRDETGQEFADQAGQGDA